MTQSQLIDITPWLFLCCSARLEGILTGKLLQSRLGTIVVIEGKAMTITPVFNQDCRDLNAPRQHIQTPMN